MCVCVCVCVCVCYMSIHFNKTFTMTLVLINISSVMLLINICASGNYRVTLLEVSVAIKFYGSKGFSTYLFFYKMFFIQQFTLAVHYTDSFCLSPYLLSLFTLSLPSTISFSLSLPCYHMYRCCSLTIIRETAISRWPV